MDYLDFELEIQPGSGRDYAVAVLHSPAGEARATMHFPFDQIALESRLDKLQIALLRSGGQRRSALSPEERAVRDFGQALFEAVFTGEVRNRYDVSCERAAQKDHGLRLKLRIQAPELAALPWEFLYDPRQAEYICLSSNTPLVRYLELPQPIQSLKVTPPLRILGVIASPSDLAPLDVTREKERVERAVADLSAQGLVELIWLEGQTWRDLQRAMQGGPWHILHFVGHGGFDTVREEGFVCLSGEDGRTQPLHATLLARLLADHRSLRLVMLNACEGARGGEQDVFSSTASILLRRGIPVVLAMQYEITDGAAIGFARAFYEALARGLPADAAASEARKAVSLEVANTVEWGTPVLYMRTPDGVLFDMSVPPSPLKAPPVPKEGLFEVTHARSPVPVQVTPAETATPPVPASIVGTFAPASQSIARPKWARSLRWFWPAVGGIAVLLMVTVVVLSRDYYDRQALLAATSTLPTVAQATVPPSSTPGPLATTSLPPTVAVRPTTAPAAAATPVSLTSTPSASPTQTTAPAAAATLVPLTSTPSASPTQTPTATIPNPSLGIGPTTVSDKDGMTLIYVQAGEFLMGSADSDSEADADEKPQHKVTLDAYWIDRTEVTLAQYRQCVAAGKCTAALCSEQVVYAENRPVVCASWQDATNYCAWAGRRLPTEAEWEKAARGTDGRKYPWGDALPDAQRVDLNKNYFGASQVGSHPAGASPYGAVDMAGNVWEWVGDWYNGTYYQNAPTQNPKGPDAGQYRVLRGGSWGGSQGDVRAANRDRYEPVLRYLYLGFRCARSS